MDRRETESPGEADYTAAVPLEIDEETATRADDLLREFAEDAGLETALIVDRSGSLVAGISAEADVTVEVISALVAGASGARAGEAALLNTYRPGGMRGGDASDSEPCLRTNPGTSLIVPCNPWRTFKPVSAAAPVVPPLPEKHQFAPDSGRSRLRPACEA